MNTWLLSIVGVVTFGVLLEILLADGETAKYIKGVFALAVVLVIVAPLPAILDKNFDINNFFGTEIEAQANFLNSVKDRQNSEREENLCKELKKQNVDVQRVRIFYLQNDIKNIDIVKIYLLSGKTEEKIFEIVQNAIGCSRDKIKVYESG